MIQYKFQLANCGIPSRQNIISSLFFNGYERELYFQNQRQNSFQSFHDYFSHYSNIFFIDKKSIDNFISLYVEYGITGIPIDVLFDSFFPISLINTINQNLSNSPKDRDLSLYIWSLSIIASLGCCTCFETEDFISMLLHICNSHSQFFKTTMHAVKCLTEVANYPICANLIIPQISCFVEWSKAFTNSQARINCFAFLTKLANYNLDEQNLLSLANLFSFYATRFQILNDMKGALLAIDCFCEISPKNLDYIYQSGFFEKLPEILFSTQSLYQSHILSILKNITNSKYIIYLMNPMIINGIYKIMCEKNSDCLKKCFEILIDILSFDRNVINLIKNTRIIENACECVSNAPYSGKKHACAFVVRLVALGDEEVIGRLAKKGAVDAIVEHEVLAGFQNAEKVAGMLEACIDGCEDEWYRNHFGEVLKHFLLESVDSVCN